MSVIYHDGSRELQDRFDTRRIADRIEDVLLHDFISEHDAAFIEDVDMFFIATADEEGRPNCSYKGGEPGFVRVVDEKTIAFPNYDGNGMYLSMGNVAETHRVGLLFIDFERQRRMRVDGVAHFTVDERLMERYPEAQFLVRVEATRIYPNCPRYIHKYQLVERSAFVPRPRVQTPIPAWKQASWAADVLPANDPAAYEG